jgi:hypothetical protein
MATGSMPASRYGRITVGAPRGWLSQYRHGGAGGDRPPRYSMRANAGDLLHRQGKIDPLRRGDPAAGAPYAIAFP